jgi:WD40 repeat protein
VSTRVHRSHAIDHRSSGIQHVLSGHSDSVRSIVSISTSMFATCSRDTTVTIWEGGGSSGVLTCVHVLRGHTRPVTSLSFDPDSGLLASTGVDACRVWRPTGACVVVLSNDQVGISTSVFVSCSEGGSMVVTGGSDGNLVTWSVTTGSKLQTLDGHTAMVRSIIAPREGCEDLLISADVTGTIIAWRYDGGWRLGWKVSEAHRFSVSAMCVKDNRLLTSGADGRIRIRQLETGVLLREIEETYDAVYDTAFGDVAGKDIVAIGSRNGRAILDVSQTRKCYIPKADDSQFY